MALSKDGLSDLIYDNIHSTFKTPKKSKPSLRKLADALADAIVTHLLENAEISVSTTVTISTTDSGLQRETTGLNPPTLAPAANKILSGTGTGTLT